MAVFNRKRVTLISTVLAVTACTVADSESVLTSGMSAYIDVIARGNGTTEVVAALAAGDTLNSARIELQGDDRLMASNGEQIRQLSKRHTGFLSYGTSLNGDSVNRRYTVDFERTVDSSTHSWTYLPEPFDITHPASDVLIEDEGVDLEWEVTHGGQLRLKVSMECSNYANQKSFRSSVTNISDDGHQYLDLDGLMSAFNQPYFFDVCDVTATLQSHQSGQLDTRFGKGGSIEGIQSRSRHFKFEP
ncbi:hypothetical protein BGP77_07010 [Saccharospirillum sp. MSK14-1]|uniref:hypothetical protein n=1 Tax=Saccharospirillum sp. MSK14-1 TaxID=1897632 RepID=UPI000D334904|nr:hypothetical protein [Saccharospirillum sp. MSK14-1]PTY37027.1 hypothetical protein BGP77_07010 [Saccharospirillum sp. MSK14-1]